MSSVRSDPPLIEYAYRHVTTKATTGYFSCEPPESLALEAALELLEGSPLDDFLHLHCLRALSAKKPEALRSLAAACYDPAADAFTRPALAALLAECAILLPRCREVCGIFPADAAARLAPVSPAVYLRAAPIAGRSGRCGLERAFSGQYLRASPAATAGRG